MAEVVEGTIYEQLGALEGFLEIVYQRSKDSSAMAIVLQNLKKIKLQAENLAASVKSFPNHPLKNKLEASLARIISSNENVTADVAAEKEVSRASNREIKKLLKEIKDFKGMVDEVPEEWVEESIDSQVKAIEGWALEIRKEAAKGSPGLENILQNLKNINLQGRKLEWRKNGLKNLPHGKIKDGLKKTVTGIRAAAMTAFGDIKSEKKISRGAQKNLDVLAAKTLEARKLIEQLKQEEEAEKTVLGNKQEEAAARSAVAKTAESPAEQTTPDHLYPGDIEEFFRKRNRDLSPEELELIKNKLLLDWIENVKDGWGFKNGLWEQYSQKKKHLSHLRIDDHHSVAAPSARDPLNLDYNELGRWFDIKGNSNDWYEGFVIKLISLAECVLESDKYPKKKGKIELVKLR